MSETKAAPHITGKMFLFDRPELLNREEHGELGLDPASKPFAFCAKISAVPVTVSEIPEAGKHYPIVFATNDDPMPVAVLGLGSDFNLFVDDDGKWESFTYIPGYLRRYPFALASEANSDRMALVLDTAYEGLSKAASRKLFNGGQMSDFVKQAMEFTRSYENDRRVTEQVVKTLKKLDLVQPQSAQYTPTGGAENRTFAQYFGIDEKKLQALPDEQFLELRRTNVLPIVYSQLMSMANWRNLISRRMHRFNLSETEAVNPQRLS